MGYLRQHGHEYKFNTKRAKICNSSPKVLMFEPSITYLTLFQICMSTFVRFPCQFNVTRTREVMNNLRSVRLTDLLVKTLLNFLVMLFACFLVTHASLRDILTPAHPGSNCVWKPSITLDYAWDRKI